MLHMEYFKRDLRKHIAYMSSQPDAYQGTMPQVSLGCIVLGRKGDHA
jgi:hypothetical protein